MERRQVFDLPPMAMRVTQHQLIARRCCCGATTIILYLYVGLFLSKKRTAHTLAELFGTPVSDATVAAMIRVPPSGWADSWRL